MSSIKCFFPKMRPVDVAVVVPTAVVVVMNGVVVWWG